MGFFGGGGGGVSGSGTENTLAKFGAGGTSVGNSRLVDTGTALTLSGVSLAPIYQVVVSLTDAQIKTLPTTPVEILAAPGANKALVFQVVMLHMKWVADYTNIAPTSSIRVDTAASYTTQISEPSLGAVTALLAGGGPDGTWVPVLPQQIAQSNVTSATPSVNPHLHHGVADSGAYDSDMVNKPLIISAENAAQGNFTDGNAGNVLQISIVYMVLNTTTGIFE